MSVTTHHSIPTTAPRPNLFTRFARWLLAADYESRQIHKLQELPPERLEDMGLTRRDLNREFYHRGGLTTDQARAVINTRMWP